VLLCFKYTYLFFVMLRRRFSKLPGDAVRRVMKVEALRRRCSKLPDDDLRRELALAPPSIARKKRGATGLFVIYNAM
jgi:hypothetical protein